MMANRFSRYPVQVEDIQPTEHFAVLINDAHMEESGDLVKYLRYLQFENQVELDKWLIENHNKQRFTVIHTTPVSFKLTTTVTISKGN